MNKVVAETAYANIVKVGMPQWTEDDQTLAKAVQKELGVEEKGLPTEVPKLNGRVVVPDDEKRGGGSDDIGDISWVVPTITLRYPANIEAGPGHNWANAIAMATPIAHKGVTAAAKVQVMTVLDLLMKPELIEQSWDYFRNVQTKDKKYTPLIRPEDKPAIWLNQDTMAKYREQMKKYYLRPDEIRDLSRAARHQVSDGEVGRDVGIVGKKPQLHDAQCKAETLRRLKTLRPDAQRRWGKMSVAQMLWHVNEAMEGALGRITIDAAKPPIPLPRPVLKFLVLNAPWGKGAPTLKRWIPQHDSYDFAAEHDRCLPAGRGARRRSRSAMRGPTAQCWAG